VKIDESNVLNIPKPQSGKVYEPVSTSQGTNSPSRGVASPGDNIDLGSQSGLMAYAQQAGSSERQDRIQELRTLVLSGQYQVDSSALSSSIVSAAANGD
jgi:anti-sigma28 factor (negative regulator of flagellin synthesis)